MVFWLVSQTERLQYAQIIVPAMGYDRDHVPYLEDNFVHAVPMFLSNVQEEQNAVEGFT